MPDARTEIARAPCRCIAARCAATMTMALTSGLRKQSRIAESPGRRREIATNESLSGLLPGVVALCAGAMIGYGRGEVGRGLKSTRPTINNGGADVGIAEEREAAFGEGFDLASECHKEALAITHERIAELEAAMRRLWDIGKTVTVDGQLGCFVPEAEWRRLVVDQAHAS